MYNNEILEKLINEELNDYGYLNADAKIEESIEMDKDEINEFLCSDGIDLEIDKESYLVHSGTLPGNLLFILITDTDFNAVALELQNTDTYEVLVNKIF